MNVFLVNLSKSVLILLISLHANAGGGGGADSGQAANRSSPNTPAQSQAQSRPSSPSRSSTSSPSTTSPSRPSSGGGTPAQNQTSSSRDNDDRPSTTSAGGGLSFGSSVKSPSSPVIGGGSEKLSYGPNIASKAPISGNPQTVKVTDLSLGKVVTDKPSSIPKGDGGYDSDGNYYSIGTPAQKTSAPMSVLNAISGAILSTELVKNVAKAVDIAGQLGYEVGVSTVNALGKAVEPHVKAITDGVKASISSGKSVMEASLSELSKPIYREQIKDVDAAIKASKKIAGNAEMLSFYREVRKSYAVQNIPEHLHFVSTGPMDHALRNVPKDQRDDDMVSKVDDAYINSEIQITVPTTSGIWSPNQMNPDEKLGPVNLTNTQRVGASTSITIVGPQSVLAGLQPYFTPADQPCTCGMAHSNQAGVTMRHPAFAGGIVMARNNNPETVADTLKHEYTHAGDIAIRKDLQDKYKNSDQLSPEEKSDVINALAASNAIFTETINNFGNVNVQFPQKYVKALGSIIEYRAYTSANPETYAKNISNTTGISIDEAKSVLDTLANNKALNEINRAVENHAAKMLGE